MKKIYIHVGMPKTGTTALQAFFYKNREILKEKGCIYPLEYGGEDIEVGGRYLHNDGNLGKLYVDTMLSDEQKADKIIELVDKYGCILLSTERIWIRTADNDDVNMLRLLQEKCGTTTEIKIIVYLRRQIEYIESQYKQVVKEKKVNIDIRDYCNKWQDSKRADYKYILTLFENIVGKENVVVRVYEKEQFVDKNIFADFLQCINIPMDTRFESISKRANVSLSNSVIELKRMINRVDYDQQIINDAFFYWMQEATCARKKTDKVIHFETSISAKDKEELMEKFLDINRYVAQRYFNREQLFFEPYSEPCKEVDNREILEDLVFVFGSMLIQMNYDVYTLKMDREQLLNIEKRMQEKQDESEIEIQGEIDKIESKMNELERQFVNEREELEMRLLSKQQEIDAIKSGYSWKITAPLRKIRRFFKR